MKEKITISREEYTKLREELDRAREINKNVLIWQNAPKRIRKTFSQKQIQRILDVIENSAKLYMKNGWGKFMRVRDKTIVMTIYFCALRPNECLSLTFNDVDFERALIMIRPETNKTKNGRIVPIPKTLMLYFKEYLSQSPYFWKNSEYIFINYGSSNHLSAERWKARFREILKEAGIYLSTNSTIPPYSSYSLRHTRATELLEKSGMDIFAVGNLLGHKSLESTKQYIHTNSKYMEYLKELMDKK